MKTKKLKFIAYKPDDTVDDSARKSKSKSLNATHQVSGLLNLPANSQSLIVLGHGAGAGMNHANMESIASALADLDIATFRYQFPFMERGGGRDAEPVSLSTVRHAILTAHELIGDLPIFAGGHSFGGRMTSLAAATPEFPKLARGLVFFAFPLHPPKRPSDSRAAHLTDIKIPMLFLSGTRDDLADLDLLKPVIKSANRKSKTNRSAKLHLLDTANHGYKILKRSRKSDECVFAEMARVTKAWQESLVGY